MKKKAHGLLRGIAISYCKKKQIVKNIVFNNIIILTKYSMNILSSYRWEDKKLANN